MPTPQFPRLHAGRGEPRGCRMYAAPIHDDGERRPYWGVSDHMRERQKARRAVAPNVGLAMVENHVPA